MSATPIASLAPSEATAFAVTIAAKNVVAHRLQLNGQPMLRNRLRDAGFGLAAAVVTHVLGKVVSAGLAL